MARGGLIPWLGTSIERPRTDRALGADNLRRWSAASVDQLSIGEQAKRFLCEVGLPKSLLQWEFDAAALEFPSVRGQANLRRIGYRHGFVPVYIDENRNGAVFIESEESDRFVNSSVETFGWFLLMFTQWLERVAPFDEDHPTRAEISAESRDKMIALDAQALDEGADSDTFWYDVVDEMINGL